MRHSRRENVFPAHAADGRGPLPALPHCRSPGRHSQSSAIMSDQGLGASVTTLTLAENWKSHSVAVAVAG